MNEDEELDKNLLLKLSYQAIIYGILPFIECKLKAFKPKYLYGYFGKDRTIYPICKNRIIKNCYLGNKLVAYKHLTSLKIADSKIRELKDSNSYPCLTSLTILWSKISELKKFPHLTSLTLQNCNKIDYLIEFPYLTSLHIWKTGISRLARYPHLKTLKIVDSEISELVEYPRLVSLEIYKSNISKLRYYPFLTSLKIIGSSKITELIEYPHLTSLTIQGSKISELIKYPLLTYLCIHNCENLEYIETRSRDEIVKYIKNYVANCELLPKK